MIIIYQTLHQDISNPLSGSRQPDFCIKSLNSGALICMTIENMPSYSRGINSFNTVYHIVFRFFGHENRSVIVSPAFIQAGNLKEKMTEGHTHCAQVEKNILSHKQE